MRQSTAPSQASTEQHPVDIETMRDTVQRALDDETEVGAAPLLLDQLRGQIQLMIPEVEDIAARQGKDDIPRYCALACLGEARRKLTIEPGPGLPNQLAHARRLARVVNALCDHHENLGAGHS